MEPIRTTYIKYNDGINHFIDVERYDEADDIKVINTLLYVSKTQSEKKRNIRFEYPIPENEVNEISFVTQPIVPPSPTMTIELPKLSTDFDVVTSDKKVKTNKTQFITEEEKLMIKRATARESAKKCRKRKRDLLVEDIKKLKELEKQNLHLRKELERIKNEAHFLGIL
jgi:hypothetical protein